MDFSSRIYHNNDIHLDVNDLGGKEMTGRYRPTPLETALLLVLLADSKNREREEATRPHADSSKDRDGVRKVRRFRISEATLKAVAGRRRIPPKFLREVEEWLFDAGWALMFAANTYAMIEVAAV